MVDDNTRAWYDVSIRFGKDNSGGMSCWNNTFHCDFTDRSGQYDDKQQAMNAIENNKDGFITYDYLSGVADIVGGADVLMQYKTRDGYAVTRQYYNSNHVNAVSPDMYKKLSSDECRAVNAFNSITIQNALTDVAYKFVNREFTGSYDNTDIWDVGNDTVKSLESMADLRFQPSSEAAAMFADSVYADLCRRYNGEATETGPAFTDTMKKACIDNNSFSLWYKDSDNVCHVSSVYNRLIDVLHPGKDGHAFGSGDIGSNVKSILRMQKLSSIPVLGRVCDIIRNNTKAWDDECTTM